MKNLTRALRYPKKYLQLLTFNYSCLVHSVFKTKQLRSILHRLVPKTKISTDILRFSQKITYFIFIFRYVFWYHNDRMVNYDVERGISVFTSSGGGGEDKSSGSPAANPATGTGGKTKSQFVISEATPTDSGNYTCKPSNAVPASIQVFVSNTRGEI